MYWRAWFAAFGFALSAASAHAQPAVDRDCSDDRGVDRCAAEQQARARALFGLRSIEEHRDSGDQVRRVFYVDGYGRDVVAIAFVRAPGRDPTAYVHFPRREGGPPTPPLEAPVPHEAWVEALGRSASFDRNFEPRPENPDEISICLHSWFYTIEANDPPRANHARASLRRKTEDACEHGPGGAFAWDLQRLALPLFPHCDRLDTDRHRNAASQLAACAALAGDRMAAAEVMNRLAGFHQARRPGEGDRLAGLFAHRARIDWNGLVSDPADLRPENFWLARMAQDEAQGFYHDRIEGLAADRVRVTGTLQRSADGAEGSETAFYRAPVEMIWVFGPAQQFEVESATVGPWERYRPG